MKIFILYAKRVSGNLHEDGGAVVIAEDLEHAKKFVPKENERIAEIKELPWSERPEGFSDHPLYNIDLQPTNEEWDAAIVYDLAEEVEPTILIFPDAGCC